MCFWLAVCSDSGGISPRVSPQISTDDAGSLLTRAGFKLLTVDTDQIVVPYPDPLSLMHELRGMGESNAVAMRRGFLPRDTLLAATAIYDELYGEVLVEDGTKVVPATFELVYMIGWAPGADQPAALERGVSPCKLTKVAPREAVGSNPDMVWAARYCCRVAHRCFGWRVERRVWHDRRASSFLSPRYRERDRWYGGEGCTRRQ